jgi:hypothetical protein
MGLWYVFSAQFLGVFPEVANEKVTALFVCKWVHSVEMDRLHDIEPSPAESELLDHIKEVLEEAEYDPGKSKSLAAGVARTWSWLLQDVSILGAGVDLVNCLLTLSRSGSGVSLP